MSLRPDPSRAIRSTGRGRRLALGLLACLAISWPPAFADTPVPAEAVQADRGEPLAAALERLEEAGLRLVYTDELVRPEMAVADSVRSSDPRRLLDRLLAPHGLTAREAPGGVLVVVRAEPAAPAVFGQVLVRGSHKPLAEATVRVVGAPTEPTASAAADGRFTLTGLAPGRLTLEAGAPGYLAQQVEVKATPGDRREVIFLLRPQPYVEDEIVVRPSQLSLLQDEPESSFALGREEIESLPHLGGDLLRAASLLPGVTGNDVSAQFSIHGGRRDEVKVLLDGQELYNAFHLPDYDNALSLVPSSILGGAELLTGTYPAVHGDRMSGVLDLRTLEPPAERKFVLSAGVLDLLASGAGRFDDGRGGWMLTGRRGSLDLAAKAIGDEDPRFWDLFGRADAATAAGHLTGRVLVGGDDLTLQKQDEDGSEVLANDYRSHYGWVTHQKGSERLLVETSAAWSRVRTRRGTVGGDEEGDFLLADRRNLEVADISQSWTFDPAASGHLPRWGWEARRYDVVLDYAKALDREITVQAPFTAPLPDEHAFLGRLRSDHLGLWVSDSFSAFDRLTAEVGARYDRHTLTDDTLISPRANLAWRLGERSVLRAAWGHFYQSQRPYELQVQDAETRLSPAELSVHSLLGYETFLLPNRLGVESLRVELFHRDIRDPRRRHESLLEPLNFFPEIEPGRARIEPDRSTAQGIELLVRGRRGARFDWWLAYSVSEVEDRIGGGTFPRSLDQPHAASVDLAFRLPKRWRLNLAWRYHTGWPTTPVEGRLVSDPEEPEEEPEDEPELAAFFGELNSERLPAYHRLDLRASRPWTLRRGTLSVYIDIQNVYNRKNVGGFDLEIDDDEGRLILDPETWPGTFPSVGLTWEF